MAHPDKRPDRDVPPPAGPPAPSEASTGLGSGFERMLGGGPDSVYPHDPDQSFTIGGGLAADQARRSLDSAPGDSDAADDQMTSGGGTSPQDHEPAPDPPRMTRQRRGRRR